MANTDGEVSDSHALDMLVVDDNTDAADMLAMLLRHHGHHVEVAYSGLLALQIALEHKPSVILLDIGLPKMDGYTIAQTLRQRAETKDSLIIAVTGYGLASDRERSLAAGFDLHLLKPVDANELFEILEERAILATENCGRKPCQAIPPPAPPPHRSERIAFPCAAPSLACETRSRQ